MGVDGSRSRRKLDNRPGVYRTARIRGIYLHANGIMVAAGVLTFLTALYL